MKLWLTRRPNGSYMATAQKPVVSRIYGSRNYDCYMLPGEPLGILNLCSEVMHKMTNGIELKKFSTIQIDLTVDIISDPEALEM